MELLEDFLEGERDESAFHEVLRFYYMKCGWKLYTIQELIKTLCRLSLVCTSPDPKEKTSSLINMYMNNRHIDQTSFQAELAIRKDAEKCIKEGEMFIISWVSRDKRRSPYRIARSLTFRLPEPDNVRGQGPLVAAGQADV